MNALCRSLLASKTRNHKRSAALVTQLCKRRVGRHAITYLDQLCRDTGYLPNDLPTLLQDRDEWSDRLMNARASSTWWWLRIHAWLKRCVIQQIRHYLYHFDSRAFVGRKLYFRYFNLLSPDNHANTRVFAIAAGYKHRLARFPRWNAMQCEQFFWQSQIQCSSVHDSQS